jgi:hypothetical protein
MNKSKKLEIFIYSLSIVVYIAYIFYAYSSMPPEYLSKIFNSDALYLPVFYQDIFIDKTGFDGIRFNGQPNFFPDMLFYFIIHFFTKDFLISTFLYSILQNLIIIILIYHLTKLIIKSFNLYYPSFINLLFVMIYCSMIFGNYPDLRFHLICNGYHTSAFILSILGLVLFFYYLKTNKIIYPILISILTILGALNDKIFILTFAIPFFATNFFLIIKNKDKKKNIYLIINVVLSTLIGYLIYRGIELYTSNSFIPQDFSITSEKIQTSFKFASKFLLNQILDLKYYSIIIIIGYLTFLISLFFFIKNLFKKTDGNQTEFVIFYEFAIVYFVFVYFTPIITGSFIFVHIFRYIVSVFYLGLIGFVIFLSVFKNTITVKIPVYLLLISTIIILLTYSIKGDMIKGLQTNLKFKPEYVKNLEIIAQSNNDLKLGIAEYWKARQTTMFNNQDLKVYATFYPGLNPELWTSHNKYWYFQKNENSVPRIFNFIVLENDADTTKFSDFFGTENLKFIKQGNISIIKVPDFIYNKETRKPQILNND